MSLVNKTAIVGIVALIAFIVIVWISGSIHYKNEEIIKHNLFETRYKDLQAVFDNTWKIISQQAQVPDKYRDDFKDVYGSIMGEGGRYGDGSTTQDPLFLFVREHNPEYSVDLYAKLSDTIRAERTNFTMKQELVNSVWLEHKNLIEVWPGSMFLGGKKVIDWEPITSAKTKEIFADGEENNVQLFKKDE